MDVKKLPLYWKILSLRNNSLTIGVVGVLSLGIVGCSSTREEPYNGSKTYVPGLKRFCAPYTVFGTTYYPQNYYEYDKEGVASWYGPGFNGRATAFGEKYNQHDMTAAHKTLPIPSLVEVTNVQNGKKAILVVNDRGPFVGTREIDLSLGAAEALDIRRKGLATVRIRALTEESLRLCKWLMEQSKTGRIQDGRSLQQVSLDPRERYGEQTLVDSSPSPSVNVVKIPYIPEKVNGSLSNLVNAVHKEPSSNRVKNKPILEPTVLQKSLDYYVVAGTYSSRRATEISRLSSIGKVHLNNIPNPFGHHKLYMAKLGPYPNTQAAKAIFNKLVSLGYKPMIVR